MPQLESVAVPVIRSEPHRHSSVHEGFVSVAMDETPELKSLSLHSLCVGIQILHQGLEEVEWFNHSHTWEKLIYTGTLLLPTTKWSRRYQLQGAAWVFQDVPQPLQEIPPVPP